MFQDRENKPTFSAVDVILHLFPSANRDNVSSLMMQPTGLRRYLAEANELTTDEVQEVLLSFDLQRASSTVMSEAS